MLSFVSYIYIISEISRNCKFYKSRHKYGFEPFGFLLQRKFLSSRCCCVNVPYGGDSQIRTDDPLLAGQVLSQLSYTPRVNGAKKWNRTTNRSRMKRVLCRLSYLGIWAVVFIQVVAASVLFVRYDFSLGLASRITDKFDVGAQSGDRTHKIAILSRAHIPVLLFGQIVLIQHKNL